MWLNTLPNGIFLNDVILWLDGSTFTDRKTKTVYTDTAVTIGAKQHGGNLMTFNGTTSGIDCEDEIIGDGDITATAWINATDFGETGFGRILDNIKFLFFVSDTEDKLGVTSDGSTQASSAVDSIVAGTTYFVATTRTSAGVVNIYIDGILSGTADQATGTPAAGTTDLHIGNRTDDDKAFNGTITQVIVFDKILTPTQIGQMYNKQKAGA